MTNVPQKIQDRLLELDGMITHIDNECSRLTIEVSGKIADLRETQAGVVQERDVLEFAVGEYEQQTPLPRFDALVAQKQTPSLPVLIATCLKTRPMTTAEMFSDISKVRHVTRGGIAGTMSGMFRRGEIRRHADGWELMAR